MNNDNHVCCVSYKDSDYADFLNQILHNFKMQSNNPIFSTNATKLFDVFIQELPDCLKRKYTCNACKDFINNYGHLVCIDSQGKKKSLLWEGEIALLFKNSINAIKKVIEKSLVTGVFISDDDDWGKNFTGTWRHMYVNARVIKNTSLLKTAKQLIADKNDEFQMLTNALNKYSRDIVTQAIRILNSGQITNANKCLPIAKWFDDAYLIQDLKNKEIKNNLLWLKVANAPTGFCHIKSGLIGTLLDDIENKLEYSVIVRKYNDKTSPLQYQRPQSLPSQGNINRAETVIHKLNIQRSFLRRYATIDDMQLVWKQDAFPVKNGFFGNVAVKNSNVKSNNDIPPKIMTWVKFEKTVLPYAKNIDIHLLGNKVYPFVSFVTATDNNAPPIIQWDDIDVRNPVSWYAYVYGTPVSSWNLKPGYNKVVGMCFSPAHWFNKNNEHFKHSINFLIDNCVDNNNVNVGLALFPEILKSELHDVRKTIEEYSKSGKLTGRDQSNANGVMFSEDIVWGVYLKLQVDNDIYILDRWD